MLVEKKDVFGTQDAASEKRRHPRQTVFKSALLYPVLQEAHLEIKNISLNGLSGYCALSMSLREQVHVSFGGDKFVTAEVRWNVGPKYGLLLEDPLFWIPGEEHVDKALPELGEPREPRTEVEISATLVTTAPVLVGTIRNRSAEGMMIEADSMREGTLLLVKSRGSDVRMGRVQWSSGGMIGLFFDPQRSKKTDW